MFPRLGPELLPVFVRRIPPPCAHVSSSCLAVPLFFVSSTSLFIAPCHDILSFTNGWSSIECFLASCVAMDGGSNKGNAGVVLFACVYVAGWATQTLLRALWCVFPWVSSLGQFLIWWSFERQFPHWLGRPPNSNSYSTTLSPSNLGMTIIWGRLLRSWTSMCIQGPKSLALCASKLFIKITWPICSHIVCRNAYFLSIGQKIYYMNPHWIV